MKIAWKVFCFDVLMGYEKPITSKKRIGWVMNFIINNISMNQGYEGCDIVLSIKVLSYI